MPGTRISTPCRAILPPMMSISSGLGLGPRPGKEIGGGGGLGFGLCIARFGGIVLDCRTGVGRGSSGREFFGCLRVAVSDFVVLYAYVDGPVSMV